MNYKEAHAQGLNVSFYTLRGGWEYFATVEEAQEARAEHLGHNGLTHRTFLYDENGRIIPEEGLSSTKRLRELT